MMVNNNISCRRIVKEKIIQDFILKNNFVRGLMMRKVSELRNNSVFIEKTPRLMVD